MYLTVRHNSGGNHGHRLKDAIGARTVAEVFGYTYVHTPYPYLDFFALGDGAPRLAGWAKHLKYRRRVTISGPHWGGITGFADAAAVFSPPSLADDSLIVLEKAARIHPCQTIRWLREGHLTTDVFSKIVRDTTRRFLARHAERRPLHASDEVRVAIHVSRGVDYDRERYPQNFSDSTNPRFMFPVSYFRRIHEQLADALGERARFTVYTEALHSEEIVAGFSGVPGVTLRVGGNRATGNFDEVHDIFYAFATSDVLVTCNSSFSTVAAYFRDRLPTIYHPHRDLYDLPAPHYVPTDVEGNLDADLVRASLASGPAAARV